MNRDNDRLLREKHRGSYSWAPKPNRNYEYSVNNKFHYESSYKPRTAELRNWLRENK